MGIIHDDCVHGYTNQGELMLIGCRHNSFKTRPNRPIQLVELRISQMFSSFN